MHFWLQKLQSSEKLVIVEGLKDKEALASLGVKNVVEIKGPLFSFVEEISDKCDECIILTDLDREGRKLYSVLKHNLQKFGVKIDSYFREYLFRNSTITNIEGLKNLQTN